MTNTLESVRVRQSPVRLYITVKMLRQQRIMMLQAMLIGDSDVAYSAARKLATFSEAYLWQNAGRFMPRW